MTITQALTEKKALSFFYGPGNTKGPFHRPMGLSAINITEADEEYVLYVAAPGMQREDFSVIIDKKIITIVAQNRGESIYKGPYKDNLSEWKRTCTLPDNADPLLMSATCVNGELEIHIPKGKNTQSKPLPVYVY